MNDLFKSGSAPALGSVHLNKDIRQHVILIEKQEAYIRQLEKENSFCRDQMSSVISHLGPNKNTFGEDEFFIPFRQDGHNDQQQLVTDLEAENASLRHQLQSQTISIQTHEHNRNIIEKLRTDNEMLTQALNNVGGELEEVKQREAEAAEEVNGVGFELALYSVL